MKKEVHPKKESNAWIFLAVVLALLIVVVSVFSDAQDASGYQRGHAALLELDCPRAVAEFDRVINAPRVIDLRSFAYMSKQEKAQCQVFQQATGQQNAGAVGDAAAAYYTLIRDNINSPLKDLAKERIKGILNSNAVGALASEAFCRDYSGTANAAVLAQSTSADIYPRIVEACGKLYEARGDWKSAIQWYNSFLEGNVGNAWADHFREAVARDVLNEVSGRNPGQLPAPFYIGQGTGSTIVLNFFNDSPDKVHVTVAGPVTRVFEMEGCGNCQTYAPPGPGACPKQGSSSSYELPVGQYHILVEAGEGDAAKPYLGYFNLGSGQYDSCYYKVQ